jgi:peptidylprolyl isomerase
VSVAADRPESRQPPPQSSGSAGAGGAGAPTPGDESCPLCGAALDPGQEWCLRCGAAARTRLAATSHWKAPIVAAAIVATLSLGVLAAALVKLAGNSSSTPTTTVTVPAAATPAPTTVTPPASTPRATTPAATTPTLGAASGPLSKEPKMTPQPRAPSQLLKNDLITGTGPVAKAGETLTVNYVGFLLHSGQEFDSSWKRGTRFSFALGTGQVIVGLNRGVPGMRVGGRRELVMPPALTYGAQGISTPIPPNETLEYIVDLLKISTPGARP